MNRRWKYSNSHGYTLIEIVMVIVILGIFGAFTFQMVGAGVQAFKKSSARKDLYDQGRLALERMVRELRDAKELTGSCSDSLTFKKAHPAQAADNTEEVKFELVGTDLKRVGDPNGTPVTAVLASNVSSFSTTEEGGGESSPGSPTVYSTAGSNTYTVPAGITTLTVKAWGAGGGGGGQNGEGGAGGGGGFAQADISVTPGENLTVVIGGGGAGGAGGSGIGGGTTTPTAGGGTGGNQGDSEAGGGGGGGGYAAVLRSSTFLVQAGGGGGGGGVGKPGRNGGAGGAGGGSSGIAGSSAGGSGGGSGTASAGGSGGSTGGTAGSANTGGNGGYVGSNANGGGGGGGGGRYGGGGGGSTSSEYGGGGGGGGSGLATGTNTTLTAGSGTTPGNNSDSDYAASAGVGGAPGANGNAGRVVIIPEGASGGGGGRNLVMVTGDGGFTGDPDDTAKKALFESWCWTVTAIDDGAGQTAFNTAAANNDVMFISESADSSTVGTDALNLNIGIVVEEAALHDEMEFCGPQNYTSGTTGTQIDIVDNSHYITSMLSTGPLTIYSSTDALVTNQATPAPGAEVLAEQIGGNNTAIVAIDTGATLDNGAGAANRRVGLFCIHESTPGNWTSSMQTLVRRSLDWAASDEAGNVVTLELTLSSSEGGSVSMRTKVFLRNLP